MKFARALRRTPATRCCAEDLPALPDEVEKRESTERSLEVDGETVTLDELGPIVVSKDGKLGHLSNWHEMTESEQVAALKFVAARNAKRRAALLKNRGGAVAANLLPTVLAAAIVLWVTEVVPLFVTALGIPVAFALTGVGSAEDALAPFFDPIIVLFFAGFLMAEAMRRVRLDHLLAVTIVGAAGRGPIRLYAALLALSACLSMFSRTPPR